MDIEAEKEENEVKNDTERAVSAHSSKEEDISPVTVNGNEKEENEVKNDTERLRPADSPSEDDISPVRINERGKEEIEVSNDTEKVVSAHCSSEEGIASVRVNGNEKDENEAQSDAEKLRPADSCNKEDISAVWVNGNEKEESEGLISADSRKEESIYPVTVNGKEKEGVPAEMVVSDHDENNSESVKATEKAPDEAAAIFEPEENSGNEVPGVDNITTTEDLADEDTEQPMSHEESVVFEINSNDGDGPPRLHLESPERENISPTEEEEEEEEEAEEEEPTAAAAPADKEDINYEEYMLLLQELSAERDKASQHSSQLQKKLAEYFRKKATGDDTQLERELPVSEQLQEYERNVNILSDLKQQLTTESETAQQQAEELSRLSQEKLDKVDKEWRAFMALKQDVAMTILSRRLGKQAAQAKVESTLAAEQLRQDELIKLRLKHIKLKMKIHRLEAELCEGEEHARDPLQLQFEQLQAERLEMKKLAEKKNEESLKIQKKISNGLELLSNVKEKLFWTQMEVQAKQERLATVEAMVARKRDLLTRTKQARNGLQRDNLRLKEHRGLLGNRVLLRDFEDTVDASDQLEEQLENLKRQQAEIVFSCGRWRKKLETTHFINK
ncbi:cilia- and flagella-associated protein 184 [Symphorus nematophorus]